MILKDGNGFINRVELRHVMMNIGEKMSEEECDALVDVSEQNTWTNWIIPARNSSICS